MQQFVKDINEQPCRVVIIGLPYSGKKQAARILAQQHSCRLLTLDSTPANLQLHKRVGSLCFETYEGKAVLVIEHCNKRALEQLKKRNFVSVIKVDAPFQKRLQNYCTKNSKEMDIGAYEQFAKIDADYQNVDYQDCEQYVRVSIHNDKDIAHLQAIIQQKIAKIIRPFRPNYDQYFMKMADIAKRRSNCMKSSVGCVIVNDNNRVVSTGYNGTPRGLPSCYDNGCSRCNHNEQRGLDECLCLHGEQSAILEVGIGRTFGCKLYTTLYPCFSCAKIIKQAGIKKIYYMTEYLKVDNGEKFLKENYRPEDVVQITIDNIYY